MPPTCAVPALLRSPLLQHPMHAHRAKIQHGIEEDMGFPPGTEMQLIELNKHDLELFGLGCILFKLDAAYYATGAYVSACM